jgi:hypothetical protein
MSAISVKVNLNSTAQISEVRPVRKQFGTKGLDSLRKLDWYLTVAHDSTIPNSDGIGVPNPKNRSNEERILYTRTRI